MDQTLSFGMPAENLKMIQPPRDAYLYFPKAEEVKYKSGKQLFRRIFDGQIELDSMDNQAIDKFIQECSEKHYKINFPKWNRQSILRFLQANQFKYDKTTKSMGEYEEWRKTLPPLYDQDVEKFLNSGIIYIQGRDHYFRPILVLNAYKIDLKVMSLEQQMKGLTFFLEVVVNNMLLPGQIENWIVILDLDYQGIIGLQINVWKFIKKQFFLLQKAIKSLMSYLQNNYRSRLYKLYVMKTTMMLNATWAMMKPFLEENTVQKIIFVKENVFINKLQYLNQLEPAFQHINKAQIEQKFGGTAPNKGISLGYWPPIMDNKNISIEKDDIQLISREEYNLLWKSGKLENNKVDQNQLDK